METIENILLIDKPKGITSYDVIRTLKRRYKDELGIVKAPKLGHAGTLDPLASGLMLVGVGAGTKKLTELVGLGKEYIAEVRIGEKRSTGDMEGEVLEARVPRGLMEEEVRSTLTEMLGVLRLPVSAYSAVKKGGVPMYKRAQKAEREGAIVTDVPVRDMEVKDVELLGFVCEEKWCVATVRFVVGSGTYIRSLGEELGERLQYPATLQNLRRTKVGEFSIEKADSLESASLVT